MTDAEKLDQLKALLQITDTAQDATLAVYLSLAKSEILSWLYSGNTPTDVTDVPTQYETVQVMACVVGYGLSGAEGQKGHSENGISRTFEYADMVEYIHRNVIPYAAVM